MSCQIAMSLFDETNFEIIIREHLTNSIHLDVMISHVLFLSSCLILQVADIILSVIKDGIVWLCRAGKNKNIMRHFRSNNDMKWRKVCVMFDLVGYFITPSWIGVGQVSLTALVLRHHETKSMSSIFIFTLKLLLTYFCA